MQACHSVKRVDFNLLAFWLDLGDFGSFCGRYQRSSEREMYSQKLPQILLLNNICNLTNEEIRPMRLKARMPEVDDSIKLKSFQCSSVARLNLECSKQVVIRHSIQYS